mmetsp:Transcript_14596/g.62563  ORF Transcript_14596/g.62563 Transcript_14596/m.62563 type:complete len:302 (+) Transcript_14596:1190-2095(+)
MHVLALQDLVRERHRFVMHAARRVPGHLRGDAPRGRSLPRNAHGGVRGVRRERRRQDALRDVVSAHLPRGHARATVPEHHHGAGRPRLIQQVPRAHDGVLHRARFGFGERSCGDLAETLPPDGHREHGVERDGDEIERSVPRGHTRDAHEASHRSRPRARLRKPGDPAVVHRRGVGFIKHVWSARLVEEKQRVARLGDPLRAEARHDARAPRDRGVDFVEIVVRDVAAHDLRAQRAERRGGGGRRVARHDARRDAHRAKRRHQPGADAAGAAHHEHELVRIGHGAARGDRGGRRVVERRGR